MSALHLVLNLPQHDTPSATSDAPPIVPASAMFCTSHDPGAAIANAVRLLAPLAHVMHCLQQECTAMMAVSLILNSVMATCASGLVDSALIIRESVYTQPVAAAGRQSNGARRGAAVGAYVVKVHESEIADDYPPPASYQRADEEADELLLFDEDGAAGLAPEDLPRRALANFALYNSEVHLHP